VDAGGSGAVEFNVYNPVGHVVVQTDDGGSLLNASVYEAFGNIVDNHKTGEQGNRLANTKERDASIGLDNHGFRYYDPEIGRYINRDPIGYGDGLNPYLYVHNNPGNYIDPHGLFTWREWAGIFAGGVEGAVGGGSIAISGLTGGFSDTIGFTNSKKYGGEQYAPSRKIIKVADGAISLTGVGGMAKKGGLKLAASATKNMVKDQVQTGAENLAIDAGAGLGIYDEEVAEKMKVAKDAMKGVGGARGKRGDGPQMGMASQPRNAQGLGW